MEWMGLNELRERFLSFFESKGHVRMPSAPLVPGEDEQSLLLINSGMAPLKKYFLGLETPPGKRVTTCQKCIRTPDIERVGITSRHGTYFEMLGNFSFGDYFKEDATQWAWEFITDELKIPVDKLWVSIYQDDDEAFKIWTEHRGVAPERMVRLGKEDNFWEIGTGPCGPCSEIYFDRGEEYGCDDPNCAVGCDCDRYVEFWNLVFTQFNSDGEGNYTPLEHPNIDTGMGLERLACIMQGVKNLFEVDTVQNIMKHVAQIAGVSYKQNEKTDVSLRVITDHIRSTVFMVGDGITPSNEGRGYVLRRLLRRAARHGRLLGIEQPFLYQVCNTVITENASAYPALAENSDYIRQIIQAEEERFAHTIEQGISMLTGIMDRISTMQISCEKIITGEDVFRLHDTFGFPLELTREIALENGFKVDETGFVTHMQQQRKASQQDRQRQQSVSWKEDVLADQNINDVFIGYEKLDATTKILDIIKDEELVSEIREGDEAVIILQETPFYAESGGQVGDNGIINVGKSIFKVTDCRKSPTGHFMHIGKVVSGFFTNGETASVFVDKRRRNSIMRNHTAAHLLQAALREVLGNHVHQAGSMVDDKICRFDFTHFSAVTPEQLINVEKLVNDYILCSHPVHVAEMSLEEAKAKGAIALFSDKYSDMVRVVDVEKTSVELCGGTHVSNTSMLGLFKILTETSVAAGVRRIEAATGRGVLAYMDRQQDILNQSCEALKVNSPSELAAKAVAVSKELRQMQKDVEDLNAKMAGAQLSALEGHVKQLGAVHFVSALLKDIPIEAVRQDADQLKDKNPAIVGVLVAVGEEKTSLLVFAGKDAVSAGIHCGKLVKEIAAVAGGSGGGRPDNAMGGIPDADQAPKAIEAAESLVLAQVK